MTENIKCTLVGDVGVGKTTAMASYVKEAFEESVPSVFDGFSANILYGNKHVCLNLCDTNGNDDHDRTRPLSYTGTGVFIVAFSVVNRKSFEHVKDKWFNEIQEHAPSVPIVLVGTKVDLREDEEEEKHVQSEEGEKLADELKLEGYYECSSKKLEGLDRMFRGVVTSVLGSSGGEGSKGGGKDCCII